MDSTLEWCPTCQRTRQTFVLAVEIPVGVVPTGLVERTIACAFCETPLRTERSGS